MVELNAVYAAGFSVFSLYVFKLWFKARAIWKRHGTIPGYRTLISGASAFGNLTREIKYITPGADKVWRDKHSGYKRYGRDTISYLSLFPTPRADLAVADARAIKTIFSSRLKFPKPVAEYKLLDFFGKNVLTTEFAEWKQHRRIVTPAFSDKNNKLAFEESVRAMTSLHEEEWHDKQEIAVDDVLSFTLAAALMTIFAAAFGRRTGWGDDEAPPGHRLSFKRSIATVGTGLFIRIICPKWLFEWAPVEKIREARDGFAEFRSYLLESINERKFSGGNERRDLLPNLIDANEELFDDGEQRLGEEELIGNMFIFYIAGHETTGHTLSFALSMLAIHQEEQEALYQHIQNVLPDGRLPTHEDAPGLNRVTAAINETMRMFPAAPAVPKYSTEDTSLVIGNEAGETIVVPIPAGSNVSADIPGLHYNPRYWDDPYTFKPERFLGKWDKDAFIPFSGGARSCIGRGFFEMTSLGMLTTLIQRYKVEPHPKFAGESFEQLKERYSEAEGMLTLTPLCSALVFKKRA